MSPHRKKPCNMIFQFFKGDNIHDVRKICSCGIHIFFLLRENLLFLHTTVVSKMTCENLPLKLGT